MNIVESSHLHTKFPNSDDKIGKNHSSQKSSTTTILKKIENRLHEWMSELSTKTQDLDSAILNRIEARDSQIGEKANQIADDCFKTAPHFKKQKNELMMDDKELDSTATFLFSKKHSFKGELKKAFEGFLPDFITQLKLKVRSEIFMGWQSPRKEQFTKKIEKIEKNLTKIRAKGIELNQEKRLLQEQMKKTTDTLAKLPQPVSDNHPLHKQLALFQKVEHSLESKIVKLDQKVLSLVNHKQSIHDKLQKISYYEKKNQEVRELLTTFGGESVKIADKASSSLLDGMYMSADAFKATLAEKGIKLGEIQFSGKKVQGFILPKDENYETNLELLEKLGLYKIGFVKQENLFYDFICSEEDLKIIDEIPVDERDFIQKDFDFTQKSTGGTVILTSGIKGIYEMHQTEIVSFLMKGMNVMVANFSGYGQSTGIPSEDNINSNMEAIYSYLQDHHPIEDKKILIKALCMSGGPATRLAAQHPEVNLFLDQTYADFQPIVSHFIKTAIDGYIKNYPEKHFIDANQSSVKIFLNSTKNQITMWGAKQLKNLSHLAAKMIAPAWSVKDHLAKVKGHVGIFLTENDELMQLDRDIYRNYQSIAQKSDKVTVMSMQAGHGDSWLDIQETRFKYSYPTPAEVNKLSKEFATDYPQTIQAMLILNKAEITQHSNFFEWIYEDLTEDLVRYPPRTARDFVNRLEKISQKVTGFQSHTPPSVILTFLSRLYHINIDLDQVKAHPEVLDEPIYKGRLQMNKYLEKASLKGNLFI